MKSLLLLVITLVLGNKVNCYNYELNEQNKTVTSTSKPKKILGSFLQSLPDGGYTVNIPKIPRLSRTTTTTTTQSPISQVIDNEEDNIDDNNDRITNSNKEGLSIIESQQVDELIYNNTSFDIPFNMPNTATPENNTFLGDDNNKYVREDLFSIIPLISEDFTLLKKPIALNDTKILNKFNTSVESAVSNRGIPFLSLDQLEKHFNKKTSTTTLIPVNEIDTTTTTISTVAELNSNDEPAVSSRGIPFLSLDQLEKHFNKKTSTTTLLPVNEINTTTTTISTVAELNSNDEPAIVNEGQELRKLGDISVMSYLTGNRTNLSPVGFRGSTGISKLDLGQQNLFLKQKDILSGKNLNLKQFLKDDLPLLSPLVNGADNVMLNKYLGKGILNKGILNKGIQNKDNGLESKLSSLEYKLPLLTKSSPFENAYRNQTSSVRAPLTNYMPFI